MISSYSLLTLTRHTPRGLFLSKFGCRFWVFDTVDGRVAVQLDEDIHAPRFAYRLLDDIPYRLGQWCGEVQLKTGEKHGGGYRGLCGLITFYRNHIFLKANAGDGRGKLLRLVDYAEEDFATWTHFQEHWQLISKTRGRRFLQYDNRGCLQPLKHYPAEFPEVPNLRA